MSASRVTVMLLPAPRPGLVRGRILHYIFLRCLHSLSIAHGPPRAASIAAVLRAHQLCSLSSHRPAQERASKRAEEAGASQESSTALQDAALCGILLSPSLLSKENDHFCPSFHQKIACGAPKNASSPCPYPGGGRCAARIGYPCGHYHPRQP